MDFLIISGISKQLENIFTLKDVTFTQQRLQKIAIAGETGSGKSTLLKIMAGLVQPDAGKVLFENEKVLGPEEKLIPGHPHIAYLSQHFELRNNYSVEEILMMANKMDDTEAEAIFEVCRINHLLKRRTDQLSGGERQRIATAKLLIASPRLLLLDEPYSNLDMVHKNILKAVINDIGEKLRITCIITSHDPIDTLSWADEILVMKDGQIIQQGTPKQIYRQPLHEYTAGLFGNYNLINDAHLKALPGLSEIKMNGKALFIRPENFEIAAKDSQSIAGKVSKVNFFGSYYEIEVLLAENVITVKTTESNIAKGDTIYLSVSTDDVWYL